MRVDNWQARVIQLLAVPGLLLSFYLLLYHNGIIPEICHASGWEDCGLVSGPSARFSSVGPVPVALIGFVGYATIFLVTWLAPWSELVDRYQPELLMGLTAIAFIVSLGLTGLELFVIHAFCRFCVISALIVTAMLLLAISFLRDTNRAVAAPEEGVIDHAPGTR
jgi:uncharacterized membrane protein